MIVSSPVLSICIFVYRATVSNGTKKQLKRNIPTWRQINKRRTEHPTQRITTQHKQLLQGESNSDSNQRFEIHVVIKRPTRGIRMGIKGLIPLNSLLVAVCKFSSTEDHRTSRVIRSQLHLNMKRRSHVRVRDYAASIINLNVTSLSGRRFRYSMIHFQNKLRPLQPAVATIHSGLDTSLSPISSQKIYSRAKISQTRLKPELLALEQCHR